MLGGLDRLRVARVGVAQHAGAGIRGQHPLEPLGGVGIGNSIHAGMVVVADGSDDAAERLERVLTTDPGTGVMRHADAGYPDALELARETGLDLPSVE